MKNLEKLTITLPTAAAGVDAVGVTELVVST